MNYEEGQVYSFYGGLWLVQLIKKSADGLHEFRVLRSPVPGPLSHICRWTEKNLANYETKAMNFTDLEKILWSI